MSDPALRFSSHPRMGAIPTNAEVAEMLEQIAELLDTQGAGRHRVRAYRNAAGWVRSADQSVGGLAAHGGVESLQSIPGVGKHIGTLIASSVRTGRSGYLERLRGEIEPEAVLSSVPGLGESLAQRIVSTLGVTTLEGLESAAHDGRLSTVSGFGPRRVEAVCIGLAGMLSGAARRRLAVGGSRQEEIERPTVAELLEIDARYRRKAAAAELKKIAPRRFNPTGESWLPIMHADLGGWHMTALYSNTARAHEYGRTDDWVIVYYERDGEEGQATIVTESRGPLRGKRVVRGREGQTKAHYGRHGRRSRVSGLATDARNTRAPGMPG